MTLAMHVICLDDRFGGTMSSLRIMWRYDDELGKVCLVVKTDVVSQLVSKQFFFC